MNRFFKIISVLALVIAIFALGRTFSHPKSIDQRPSLDEIFTKTRQSVSNNS